MCEFSYIHTTLYHTFYINFKITYGLYIESKIALYL